MEYCIQYFFVLENTVVSYFLSLPYILSSHLVTRLLLFPPFFCWQREYDENEVDPYHGQQEKEPEVEPLDLPDNLNLESNEKSDDEEDEGTENLYKFLDESHVEMGGTIRSWALFSIERREVMVGFCITTKKLQINLCIKIPTYQMQARQELSITAFSFTSLSSTLWSWLSHVIQEIQPNLCWNLLI